MQKIDINVKDRELVVLGTFRIASGSKNDVFIRFNFDPGYGWEDLDITAIYTRTDQRAYTVHIQPDVYYPIPMSVLSRPGNIFVGLYGCKNGDTVATTLTATLTLEYNALNILSETDIYPINDNGTIDNSAYAQYVAAVNAAANRAETAANRAESISVGWYTKDECDEKFALKSRVNVNADGEFLTTGVIPGTTPTIEVNAVAPLGIVGSVESPAPLKCIERLHIRVASDTSSTDINYGGFKLRRLSDDCYDKLILNKVGAVKEEQVYELKLSDHPGAWISADKYRVSLVNAPELCLGRSRNCVTNVGDCVIEYTDAYITLLLPSTITATQLNSVVIWYPLARTNSTVVSTTGLTSFSKDSKKILVFKEVNGEESAATFSIATELDAATYINSLVSEITLDNAAIRALSDRIQVLEDYIRRFHNTNAVKISADKWSVSGSKSVLQVNIKNVYPLNLQVKDALGAITSIDFTYTDNDNGFLLSYVGSPTDAVLIYSI